MIMDGEVPTLRIARPTDDLDRLLPFYVDGVMLGAPGAPYHFEFTQTAKHRAGRAPTQDHLLVFYMPERAAWEAAVARMGGAGFSPVPAFNPYWDRDGVTFEDPDGYRIVFQHAAWQR
jgi:hypothetical protein